MTLYGFAHADERARLRPPDGRERASGRRSRSASCPRSRPTRIRRAVVAGRRRRAHGRARGRQEGRAARGARPPRQARRGRRLVVIGSARRRPRGARRARAHARTRRRRRSPGSRRRRARGRGAAPRGASEGGTMSAVTDGCGRRSRLGGGRRRVSPEDREFDVALRPRSLGGLRRAGPREGAALGAAGRRAQAARRAGRPPPLQRAARARQDDARADRRARRWGRGSSPRAGRRSSGRATWPRSSRTSARATSCSSTRSIGCRAPWRRSCTRRSRTSSSTSCSGKGPTARSIRLDLPRFTLIGATTRPGRITLPLRERFGFSPRLDYYDVEDLAAIVLRSAGILGVADRARRGAPQIARRSRGTPRIANRLLRRVRDVAAGPPRRRDRASDVARAGLEMFEVDEEGLDRLDVAILHAVVEKFGGGPVGLTTLAAAVGRSPTPSRTSWSPTCSSWGSCSARHEAARPPTRAYRAPGRRRRPDSSRSVDPFPQVDSLADPFRKDLR